MRQHAFAAKAAVMSAVFAIASSAVASTVDSLEKPPFFPASTATGEVSGNFGGNITSIDVSEPAEFQITIDTVPAPAEAVLEPAEEVFAAAAPDVYAGGIAAERGFIAQDALASGRPAPLPETSLAVERAYRAPATAIASVSTAAGIVVPLPATGFLLCLGLFGLSRVTRRSA